MDEHPDAAFARALRTIADAELATGGRAFMGWPDRWYERPGPKWRCRNGHVSTRVLKSEQHGDVCLGCYPEVAHVNVTFPEDGDGPIRHPLAREGVARPLSAAMLVPHPRSLYGDEERFAAIRSRKRGGAVTLPGGKAEPGETHAQCACRECIEEVGLHIASLKPLFRADCEGYDCVVFLGYATLRSIVEMRGSAEGEACWVTREQLRAGPYGAWYAPMFEAYDGRHARRSADEALNRGDIAAWLASRPRPPVAHYHGCPECYEKVACTLACAIEGDLGEHKGAPMGSHYVCDRCREVSDET